VRNRYGKMHGARLRLATFVHALLGAFAGGALVVAAFKFATHSWVVDAPGWLVSRFLPIDFHEGEGALGFVLAVFLSWLCASFSAWILIRGTGRYLKRRPNDSH